MSLGSGEPYRTPASRCAEPEPEAETAGRSDDFAVLAVAFFLGSLIALAGLVSDDASTTPTAIGLIIMAFSASSFVSEVWRARSSHIKKA